MPQIVPVQIDVSELLLAFGGEVLVAALPPSWIDAVRLQDGHLPGPLERLEGFADFIAEDRHLVALVPASTVEPQPFQHRQ